LLFLVQKAGVSVRKNPKNAGNVAGPFGTKNYVFSVLWHDFMLGKHRNGVEKAGITGNHLPFGKKKLTAAYNSLQVCSLTGFRDTI
jgi:hypothetical protein